MYNAQDFANLVEWVVAKLQKAGELIFFYAGHGYEHEGRLWLVPIDATSDTLDSCLALDDLLQGVQDRAAHFQRAEKPDFVVLLDMCRLSPVSRSRSVLSVTNPLHQTRLSKKLDTAVIAASGPGCPAFSDTKGFLTEAFIASVLSLPGAGFSKLHEVLSEKLQKPFQKPWLLQNGCVKMVVNPLIPPQSKITNLQDCCHVVAQCLVKISQAERCATLVWERKLSLSSLANPSGVTGSWPVGDLLKISASQRIRMVQKMWGYQDIIPIHILFIYSLIY